MLQPWIRIGQPLEDVVDDYERSFFLLALGNAGMRASLPALAAHLPNARREETGEEEEVFETDEEVFGGGGENCGKEDEEGEEYEELPRPGDPAEEPHVAEDKAKLGSDAGKDEFQRVDPKKHVLNPVLSELSMHSPASLEHQDEVL